MQVLHSECTAVTNRQNYIKPAVKAKPELIMEALRKVATVLDLADDQKETVFFSSLDARDSLIDVMHAWSQTALLLADTGDITSASIRMIANSIQVGNQDVLF